MSTGPGTLAGQQVGRYRVEESIGRGGMAEVWRAIDTRLGRAVAIKVIRPALASDPAFVERFLREARLAAGIDHPNVVPVYDFGDHEGQPYLVMPLLEGGSLARRLVGEPFALARVVEWTWQLGSALDAAHAVGVLHRDVKPANVLLGRDERLYLADFGIARATDSATQLTATNAVVGTPVYMAPELVQGRTATAASDRYALAIVVWELLVGRPPFEGDTALSLMHQHVSGEVPTITERVPALPAAADELFRSALAKDPEARPASGRELAQSLAAVLETDAEATSAWSFGDRLGGATPPTMRRSTPATGIPAQAATRVLPSPTGATPTVVQRSSDEKNRRPGSLAAAVALLVIAAALLLVLRYRRPEPPPEMSAQDAIPTESPAGGVVGPPSTGPSEAAPAAVASVAAPEATITTAPAPLAAAAPPPPAGAVVLTAPEAARRLRGLRAFDHRLTREDFSAALQARAAGWTEGSARAAEAYARGGLAYLDGDREEALAVLRRAAADPQAGGFPGLVPVLVAGGPGAALPAWQLALFYGDPLGQAATAVAASLASRPADPAALMGEAVLQRLAARPVAAAAAAEKVWALEVPTAARPAVARFTAEALLAQGRPADAATWAARAKGATTSGAAATTAAEAPSAAAPAASEPSTAPSTPPAHALPAEAAMRRLDRACKAGDPRACAQLKAAKKREAGRGHSPRPPAG